MDTTNTDNNNDGRVLYRYHQLGDYGRWTPRVETDVHDPWSHAAKYEATRVTVLCVSEEAEADNLSTEVYYAGNLYFDIDDMDVDTAIRSANQLVAKLIALGVEREDIEVHLSGKKGVHIYVDSRIFSRDICLQRLPEVYGRMAMSLWVEGMDFAVYSLGKGRMVRPINAKRPEGIYKVQIPLEELRSLTSEAYREWVTSPKPVLPKGPVKWSPKLAKIYDTCKKSLAQTKTNLKPVPKENLAALGSAVPDCVELLAQGKRKKIKGDSNTSFNAVAMQVGCWSKLNLIERTQLSSLHQRIANNNPSSSGESPASRVRKLEAMHYYLIQQDQYSFSCAGIKNVLSEKPNCAACPLQQLLKSNTMSDAMFLTEHEGSYYADKDRNVLVAPFTLVRDSIVIDEESKRVKSTSLTVRVPMTGEYFKVHGFIEEAWTSKQSFKKELSGIDGVTFLGTDNDVARLRMTLTRDDLLNGAEIKQVMEARRIGIEYKRRFGPENPRDPQHKGIRVYIEPGFSINNVGLMETHIITAEVPPMGAPCMKTKDFNAPISNKANEAFDLLTRINFPGPLATIMGWFLATHLKSHLFVLNHRFPLLCLSGIAETGKNATSAVMMRLCGVEGERAWMTLEVPQSTNFPFQQALSDSVTVPRIINEMNPKSVSQKQYTRVIELLKAAFDSRDIARGTIGGGDRGGYNVSSMYWKITAPVVTLSEEPINSPAVLHRAIMIDMLKQGKDAGMEAFRQLEPRADDLVDIGRVLIASALATDMAELIELFDAVELPKEVNESGMPERLKYGYQVVLTAYDWALRYLPGYGLSDSNIERLKFMRSSFLEYIAGSALSISTETKVTEVDLVLRSIAIMANSSDSMQNPAFAVTKGVHYVIIDQVLYIDILMVYNSLRFYKRSTGDTLSIRTPEAFLKVVKSMDYYISDMAVTEFLPTRGRAVLALDVDLMATKGIPVSMFE